MKERRLLRYGDCPVASMISSLWSSGSTRPAAAQASGVYIRRSAEAACVGKHPAPSWWGGGSVTPHLRVVNEPEDRNLRESFGLGGPSPFLLPLWRPPRRHR